MTRHEARQCALQVLYQIEMSQAETVDAIAFVLEDKTFTDADVDYIRRLVEGTIGNETALDEAIASVIERWSPERIGRVERNILRLATYELRFERDVQGATILDEAVRLAKGFSTETSGKFVNGVLARIIAHERPDEVAARASASALDVAEVPAETVDDAANTGEKNG